MHFLRVEVVLQAATYFVVFTDADSMPPPIRINNFSQVPVQFFQVRLNSIWFPTRMWRRKNLSIFFFFVQTGTSVESLQSIVRPQASVDYAWDEPLGPSNLTLIAPGGASATYDINSTVDDSSISLTYENFIYIAFTATFNRFLYYYFFFQNVSLGNRSNELIN